MVIDRRNLLLGAGASLWGYRCFGSVQSVPPGAAVSVEQFGARANSGRDDTRAIQAAIAQVERSGGGTVIIPGRYRCGNVVISGSNVRIQGQGGWLIDGRLTIDPTATNIEIVDLGILDTRGDRRTYLLDISGRNCRFSNVELVKDPAAGGYQMYVRQPSAACRFTGLRLRGSNGIFVAGTDHLFERFELQSKMIEGQSGDDAFAIKGADDETRNIVIRNGVVRGYAAIVSFGSEVGSRGGGKTPRGAVRNVTVENVTGDRCSRLAFFKPGALKADWRNGLVEGIRLRNLTLNDPSGELFRIGIHMIAGRGATIRGIEARQIRIVARARDRGVTPTAAVDISLRDIGAPARIEDVDLQLAYADPYSGAPHAGDVPGYPIDYIVRIEKGKGRSGSMSNIVLDVDGRGSSRGGIFVGPGLDDAIDVRRAILTRVATDPRTPKGGGGIWSNSRIRVGETRIDSVNLPDFGGSAFERRNN